MQSAQWIGVDEGRGALTQHIGTHSSQSAGSSLVFINQKYSLMRRIISCLSENATPSFL